MSFGLAHGPAKRQCLKAFCFWSGLYLMEDVADKRALTVNEFYFSPFSNSRYELYSPSINSSND